MSIYRKYRDGHAHAVSGDGSAAGIAPGKTTLTQQVQFPASDVPVQAHGGAGPAVERRSAQATAVAGSAGSRSSLPSGSIQRLFGRPDASAGKPEAGGPLGAGPTSREARDGNGVAAGAEDAVASAGSSGGSALPGTVMSKFQSSLGTDLSAVRVHTGAESAAASDAVGARAYTTGQDIHFAAGQYDPSSGTGEHLLAHEVAHTVQQSAGPPTRQNKLEVSSPGDPAEHEADGAADAMVAGAPFTIRGGGASAARQIARKPAELGAGGKVTAGDGFARLQLEGSLKKELPYAALTVSGQVSWGAEAEVKWNPDAHGGSLSGKGTENTEGKQGVQVEEEVPVWKSAATKALTAEAERHIADYVTPVEASLVFGADGSDKPADNKAQKPGENKGSVSVGIKCKTRSNDSYTVKVQFFEIQKTGDVTDVVGPAVKANYDKKFKLEPIDVQAAGAPAKLTVTGSLKPELAFKPNWAWIGQQIAEHATVDAAATAIETAALAGPPFLAALIIAQGIYIAGEEGQRDAQILEGAKDAASAAMVYAQVMTGSDLPGTGPRSQKAHAKAMAELAEIAASNKTTVEQLMTDLRQRAQSDFMRVYGPSRQQALNAYQGEVSKAIAAWRKEHWIAAMWTRQGDDEAAVMKLVEMVWSGMP
jgi:uncharacterized protein DUF4157